MPSKRRVVVLVTLVATLWVLVFGTASAADPDQVLRGTNSPPTGSITHTVWSGSVVNYEQLEARFTLDVAAGAKVSMRWTCNGGITSGTVTEDRTGTTASSGPMAQAIYTSIVEPTGNLSYCAYSLWSVNGGYFRVSNATVAVWLRPGNGEGGAGGATPTPTASPSPTPSEPPPCEAGERTETVTHPSTGATVYTYTVVTWCEHTEPAMQQWIDAGGWTQPHMYDFSPYEYFTKTGEVRAYNGFSLDAKPTPDGGYIGLRVALSTNCTAVTGSLPTEDGTLAGSTTWELTATGTVRWAVLTTTTGTEYQPCGFVGSHLGYGPYGPTTLTEGSETWFGPVFPDGDNPTEGEVTDTDGDGYTDGEEEAAGTDPEDPESYPGAPSPSPSGGSPTPDPSGTAPPLPTFGAPDPNDPGNGGNGVPGNGGNLGGGATGCEPTYPKPGMIEPTTVQDCDFPAFDGDIFGFIGNLLNSILCRIVNIAVILGNAVGWVWNRGIDLVVPSDCLPGLIEAGLAAVMAEPPLSWFTQVQEALGGQTAGSASIPAIPLIGGGSIPFPMAEIGAGGAGIRPILAAAVWLLAAVAVLRLVVGAFGVRTGGE